MSTVHSRQWLSLANRRMVRASLNAAVASVSRLSAADHSSSHV